MRKELIQNFGGFKTSKGDVSKIESLLQIEIPEGLVEFICTYGDCFLNDCYYEKDEIYVVPNYICGTSNKNPNILALIEGNIFYNNTDYLPFAIDLGGWVFNISLRDDESYGEVWLNAFDNGEEHSFRFISKSIKEFLSNLKLVETGEK